MTARDVVEERGLDYTCPTCKAQPGEVCNVRNNRSRTMHLPRVDKGIRAFNREQGRMIERADANYRVIVGEIDREPVVLVKVEKNAYGPNFHRGTFGCPWCGGQHSHGVGDEEYHTPTDRRSHCAHHAAPQHYWLVADIKAVPK